LDRAASFLSSASRFTRRHRSPVSLREEKSLAVVEGQQVRRFILACRRVGGRISSNQSAFSEPSSFSVSALSRPSLFQFLASYLSKAVDWRMKSLLA